MIATMKWFGLAFWLLLGFTEGQNGGIDPQCNIIAEEVLQLKLPLIDQLKAFDADPKFQYDWYIFFHDDCFYDQFICGYHVETDSYGRAFRNAVNIFQVKGEILNATLNVARIISSHDLKLKQHETRKFELLTRYYNYQTMYKIQPFDIFVSEFVDNYDSLASASRCEPCTDLNEFTLCLYKELNEINEGLAIFQEVAVSRRPVLIADTIDLLIKEFNNFPNITNEQIFDFYKNTVFIREENRYIDDVESRYGYYLKGHVKDFANNFIRLVQTILEPDSTQNTCVGNVLKDVITQIKPYLTPIPKTLPKWNFEKILSSYVEPFNRPNRNLTDLNLIEIFEAGFAAYRNSIFPQDFNDDINEGYYYSPRDFEYDVYNPYSDHISYITRKGFADLKRCEDFTLVYNGNSDFKYFVDEGDIYDQWYVMTFEDGYESRHFNG